MCLPGVAALHAFGKVKSLPGRWVKVGQTCARATAQTMTALPTRSQGMMS